MIDKLTARELADRLDAGERFTLIDTRPEDSFEAWHIAGAHNLPFGPNDTMDDDQFERVREIVGTDSDPIYAICGKGISSTTFALELDERSDGHDFDVSVIRGGMEDWSKVYEVVPIDTDHDDLELVQVQRRAKGCLGYLVGSRRTGDAVAVDVTRQTDVFKVAAQEAGLTITDVIDTHVHADHISGGRDLAAELDVPYRLSGHLDDRDVAIDFEFESMHDGDALTVGDVEIEAIHAPGHTTEMVNLLVGDVALLSSDTLFVDGVGRTELQFGDEGARRGAELLYDSANERFADLADDVLVFPGHVTVTADGEYESGSPGEPICARLGELRGSLDVFTVEREEFVEQIVDRDPEKPPNYEEVIAINAGEESVDRDEEATQLELGPNNCAA